MALRRLVAVNAAFLDELEKRGLAAKHSVAEKPPPATKLTLLSRLFKQTEHKPDKTPRFVYKSPCVIACRSCRQTTNRRSLTRWLCTPCGALGPSDFSTKPHLVRRQGAQQPLPLQVGNSILHPTHAFHFTRGIWVCTTCGVYTTASEGKRSSPQKAAMPCKPPTAFGADVLRRIEKGLTPRASMKEWPADTDAASSKRLKSSGPSAEATLVDYMGGELDGPAVFTPRFRILGKRRFEDVMNSQSAFASLSSVVAKRPCLRIRGKRAADIDTDYPVKKPCIQLA